MQALKVIKRLVKLGKPVLDLVLLGPRPDTDQLRSRVTMVVRTSIEWLVFHKRRDDDGPGIEVRRVSLTQGCPQEVVAHLAQMQREDRNAISVFRGAE